MPTNNDSRNRATEVQPTTDSWWKQKIHGWNDFWFQGVDPLGLGVVRIVLGLVTLFWLWSFHGQIDALFGQQGLVSATAKTTLAGQNEGVELPRTQWSPANWMSTSAIHVVYWLGIVATLLFTVGVATRWTSLIVLFAAATFTSNLFVELEGDVLLWMGLFYITAAYVCIGWSRPSVSPAFLLGDGRSVIAQPFGGRHSDDPREGSVAANFWLRVFQVHFALYMAVSCLQKLRVVEWWAGDALWFPFHSALTTTYDSIVEERLARSADLTRSLYGVATYAVIIWQLSFPFLIWRSGWRRFYQWTSLLGAIVLWSGYQDPAYAGMLLIGCMSFTPAQAWQRWAHRVLGRSMQANLQDAKEGQAVAARSVGKSGERIAVASGRAS